MGALFTRFQRWFAPAMLLAVLSAILFLILAAGSGPMLAAAPQQAAESQLFLPHISRTKPPPLIELVPFVTGFENKTIMDITHAGDQRLFVANREGKIWIVNPNGTILEPPFLDISDKVRYQDNFEQGLLGLAFHPDYPNTPYYYVAYTTFSHIQIARGEVNPATPNVADERLLVSFIRIRKPDATGGPSPVHNAGDLAFGPDGYLYIPVGDGGPDPYDALGVPGDPLNNSQRRDNLLGGILRLDPDPTRGLPMDCGISNGYYSIPRDNPWLNDFGCDELWMMGLRNPWRMVIDDVTGDFIITDVGEWRREEVNYVRAAEAGGQNFGWHCWEGTFNYAQAAPDIAHTCTEEIDFTFPVFEYDHSVGGCSVIGGRLYRGSKYPDFYERYFFGDWCTGELWSMYLHGGKWQVDRAGRQRIQFSTFGEDINGELYGAGYKSGTLYKLVIH